MKHVGEKVLQITWNSAVEKSWTRHLEYVTRDIWCFYLTYSSLENLSSSVDRFISTSIYLKFSWIALQRYRRGHEFESSKRLNSNNVNFRRRLPDFCAWFDLIWFHQRCLHHSAFDFSWFLVSIPHPFLSQIALLCLSVLICVINRFKFANLRKFGCSEAISCLITWLLIHLLYWFNIKFNLLTAHTTVNVTVGCSS